MSLAVACLTFLTTIWGAGVVFAWLLDLTGISALLVWGSVGPISLRFRSAWRAQGRTLDDLEALAAWTARPASERPFLLLDLRISGDVIAPYQQEIIRVNS